MRYQMTGWRLLAALVRLHLPRRHLSGSLRAVAEADNYQLDRPPAEPLS